MKKTIFLPLISSIFLLIFIGCSSDDVAVPDDNPGTATLEAETRLNVSYGSHPSRVYDLYLPAGRTATTTKVIMLVHGGGWTSGNKADMVEILISLQEQYPGYAYINTNYVLANTFTPAFPNQFLDIDSVIQKIVQEQEDLQVLPEFGIIGVSAGAHISLMYDYVYDTADRVKFVGNIVGPTDFTDPFYANNPNFGLLLSMLVDEDAYPAGTNYAEAVSPVFQVSASSSPTVMFYGDQDPLVPLSNGISLENALNSVPVTNSFTVYSGGHGSDWSVEDRLDLRVKLSAYIDSYLGL